jgi:hypothetical protein
MPMELPNWLDTVRQFHPGLIFTGKAKSLHLLYGALVVLPKKLRYWKLAILNSDLRSKRPKSKFGKGVQNLW